MIKFFLNTVTSYLMKLKTYFLMTMFTTVLLAEVAYSMYYYEMGNICLLMQKDGQFY